MDKVGQLPAVVDRLARLADRLGQCRGTTAEDTNLAHLGVGEAEEQVRFSIIFNTNKQLT